MLVTSLCNSALLLDLEEDVFLLLYMTKINGTTTNRKLAGHGIDRPQDQEEVRCVEIRCRSNQQ